MKIRIYIAGAMSSSDPVQFLENLRKGIRESARALLAGFSVFSPFIDFQMFLSLQGDERITAEQIKTSSLEWLKVADAVLLVPGWESSSGTKTELEWAKKWCIPVFNSVEELKEEFRLWQSSEPKQLIRF
jgi:nucleoside 2-deoxyribosyltransferase